ncbi:ABC transporter permease [Microbacterium phosphatis]|uniref:ABC transporter permease n=1 Tax=Microbacterium phosphatis TaxID=3140248 RepID=UPI003140ABD3
MLAAAGTLIADGELTAALAASLPRATIGTVAGAATGILLGFVAGSSRLGSDIVDRPMQMVRAVPFTALTPLFILWFGIGELPKIALVAVGTAVPLYLNTYAGIRGVDRHLVEVMRVLDAGRLMLWRKLLLPAALPQILTGLRFGLGIGWIALIVAETVAASSGIGFLLTTARQYSRTDVVIVCIVVYALLGVLTDLLVRLLEARLLSWRPAAAAAD